MSTSKSFQDRASRRKSAVADPRRILGMFSVSLFGAAVATYLTSGYLRMTEIACTDAGCDVVRQWHDQHLPKAVLPLLGLVYFVALAGLTVGIAFSRDKKGTTLAMASLLMAAAGLATVAALTMIEATALHAFCFWCVLIAVATVAYFALALPEWRAWHRAPREYRLDFEPFMKWGAVPLALVFLIASGLKPHAATPPVDAQAPKPTIPNMRVLVRPDSHTMGPAKAAVTVVEFADPACPACARERLVIEQVLRKYPKQVRLVYRHFPLKSHLTSRLACEALESAAAQGKFWQLREVLFMHQEEQQEPRLYEFARQVGLNMDRFKADLTSHKYAARVQQDRADGDQLEIHSTPTIFVNGAERFASPVPFDTLDAAIKTHLGRTRPVAHAG